MIRTAHERALFEDLIDLHAKYIFNENDLIIINTLRHWALRAVVRFAETFASRSSPYFHIINLFSSQPVKGELGPNVRHYREAFAAILQSHRRDRINLYADSDTLISEYQELGAVNIQLAPFPQYFALPRDYDATKELKVAYIGEAREHKGFHMLPFVSQRLQRAKVPARLLIQSFTSDPSQPFYQRSITFLSRAPNVELFSEALSRSQFSDLLELSDIFLLPYGLETYHTQTSAVFAAAMSLGTPVVATRGTWMGRKVTKYGVGALCNPADYLSVANALDVVIKDYPKFKEASIEASASWRRFNSAENFLRLVGAV
jgi:glycosyltransferase involved in cell wall biosynthesis